MAKTKKCIVQINAVYGNGSTGSMVYDIHHFLEENGYNSYIFTSSSNSIEKKCKKIKVVGNRIDHTIHAILWRIFQVWHLESIRMEFIYFYIKTLQEIEADFS